jgi:hypothetical protein
VHFSETSDCMVVTCLSERYCPHRVTPGIVDDNVDENMSRDYRDGRSEFRSLSAFTSGPEREPDYSLCHYRVYAYKLRSREWGE